MKYYQQDFMIKLGETSKGDIIEVPDLILFGAALLFAALLFSLLSNNQ